MGVIRIGGNLGASTGVAVTSSGTPDTLGAFATLRAAGGGEPDVEAFHLNVKVTTGTSRDFVLVLYHGPSDTEFFRTTMRTTSSDRTEDYHMPVRIPGNIQVRAQCQDGTGSGVLNITLAGQEAHPLVPTGADEAVLLTTQSGSQIRTDVDTGGTANTLVSTQLVAATGEDFNCFVVRIRDATSGTADALFRLLDDATAFAQYGYKRLTNAAPVTVIYGPYFHDVASGSEITIEGQSSSTTVNDFQATLWGMNLPDPAAAGGATSLAGPGGLVG